MFLLTFVQFGIISMRGGAMYNYFHSYVDKGAMYDWLQTLHLTAAPLAPGAAAPGGILEWLGYIVHADRSDLSNSNVADVGNSIINLIGTAVIITVILLSPSLSRKFGKKAVAVVGFALTAAASAAFYLPGPTNIGAMIALSVLWSICYAPTIPLCWAMFAGLSLGSASLLWLLSMYGYAANQPQTARTVEGIRMCSSIYVGILFVACTGFVLAYKINKAMTHQIADELAERRRRFAAA
jgi:Na+/melibiose symporter-like transporter